MLVLGYYLRIGLFPLTVGTKKQNYCFSLISGAAHQYTEQILVEF